MLWLIIHIVDAGFWNGHDKIVHCIKLLNLTLLCRIKVRILLHASSSVALTIKAHEYNADIIYDSLQYSCSTFRNISHLDEKLEIPKAADSHLTPSIFDDELVK